MGIDNDDSRYQTWEEQNPYAVRLEEQRREDEFNREVERRVQSEGDGLFANLAYILSNLSGILKVFGWIAVGAIISPVFTHPGMFLGWWIWLGFGILSTIRTLRDWPSKGKIGRFFNVFRLSLALVITIWFFFSLF